MSVQYRYADQAAVSGFTAETAYDTAGTINATNFFTLQEFELGISYDDQRRDSGMGDGAEFGSDGYVVRKDVKMTLTIPQLRPNDLAFLAAYGLGTAAATQDAALTAYRHANTLASTLPSFSVLATEAGIKMLYAGCKINTLTISRNDAYWQGVAEIIGSGRRVSDATAFPATISEQPLLWANTNIWLESGADVDIAATPTQGSEGISAATPTDIRTRVFDGPNIAINNNLRVDDGYLAANANDELARGQLTRGARREISVDFTMTFESAQEETDFLGSSNMQTHMALEVHNKETAQGVIASTGAMFYGGIVVLPRFVYDTIGSSADSDGVITRSLKGIVKTPTSADEGSTDPIQIYSFTAQTGYAG